MNDAAILKGGCVLTLILEKSPLVPRRQSLAPGLTMVQSSLSTKHTLMAWSMLSSHTCGACREMHTLGNRCLNAVP